MRAVPYTLLIVILPFKEVGQSASKILLTARWALLHHYLWFRYGCANSFVRKNTDSIEINLVFHIHILSKYRYILQTSLERSSQMVVTANAHQDRVGYFTTVRYHSRRGQLMSTRSFQSLGKAQHIFKAVSLKPKN